MTFRIFNEGVLFVQYFLRAGILMMLIVQCFVLARLYNKKGNRLMGCFLFFMMLFYLSDNEVFGMLGISDPEVLNRVLAAPVLLVPISSYFAVRSYIKPHQTIRGRDWFYVLPWLGELLLSSTMLWLSRWYFTAEGWRNWSLAYVFVVELPLLCYTVYLYYLNRQMLQRHIKDIKMLHADTEQVDLKWLQNFNLCVLLLVFSYLLRSTLAIELIYDLGDLLALFVTGYIGVNLVQQRELYPDQLYVQQAEVVAFKQEIEADPVDEVMQEKANLLENIMEHKQPYLNQQLTLSDLAYLLDMRPADLSQLLASSFGTNFYAYVNRYRIAYCKQLLTSTHLEHMSMEGIAKESGFNSKSTFYARFKEFTGFTPLQYARAHAK